MHIVGIFEAMLPYIVKIELSPIKIEDDDKCWRTLTITASGCTVRLTLTGPTPEALKIRVRK